MTAENNGPLVIKAAEVADVPVLIGLIRELAEFENLLDEVKADEETMRASLFGPGSTARALLLYYNSTPAGYCIYFRNFSTFLARPGLYVEDVYIRPQFRRLGLGRAVFGELGKLAVEQGCGRLEFAVLDWNQAAIDFYQALGAAPLSDWRLFRFSGPSLDRLAGR
ncbi:MAG: GNAT family N-acetyltransferase [Pseudomonadota bacterium]